MKKMMTVNQVSKLTGVSIRTLQYYDKIGLLSPARYTDSGYRLYDDTALERLQQILLFKELEFALKDIKCIVSDPDFDRQKALQQQIKLLELKRDHLDGLIRYAREIEKNGVKTMDFKAFDTTKLEEYKQRAKEEWGNSAQYKEFEEKDSKRSVQDNKRIAEEFMGLFSEFGRMKDQPADSPQVQSQVGKLKAYISENFYECTDEVLAGLGKMYCAGGEFTENIDSAGGKGTAAFTAKAIEIFCAKL